MSTLCDCITLFSSKVHCSNKTSPYWEASPLNVLNFGILPTTWEATVGQEISHCGSGICLGNCVFAPSTNMLSSLPTQCNQSPIVTCLGVATSHPIFTLQSNHILMDCNVLQNFSMSSPSTNSNKVFFLSRFCTTIWSKVICSYSCQVMISEFVNVCYNACPFSSSIMKIMALKLLSIIGIRGTLIVDNVDILTISEC